MSEFCKQCAEDLGFPNNDASFLWDENKHKLSEEELKSGEWGFPFLCEGCGEALVHEDGRCIAKQCLKKHGLTED
jgi:hypothetical protein